MQTPGAIAKLQFKQDILPTVGSSLSTDDLLSRLRALHEELATLGQNKIDLTSLDKYASDLVNRKLLKHKDGGVRAFVGCCLSDILRLYAPDAPYTDSNLTDIFKLFLYEFERLGNPENGYYIQQTYLLTKLLEYRSIVLIADLPTSNRLLEQLFSIFYDESKSFQPKLLNVIGGTLGEALSEFDAVPLNVLKLIFNKFLTYNPKEIPKGLGVSTNCGYELTLILCNVYSNRISRQLTSYYSEILYNISKHEEDGYSSNIELVQATQKLHKLVLRLWETVPDLVAAVIGFVYQELSSSNENVRKLATKLVGTLLTVDTDINFVETHKDTFNVWISKVADISTSVRVQWVETIIEILSSKEDVPTEISKGLGKTLIDVDSQVRRASVLVFCKVNVEDIWKNIHETSVYSSLLHLTRERNREVRDLCIRTVAKFYSESLENIKRTFENKDIWDIVDAIPTALFHLYYINDPHINELVDGVLFEYLLPLEVQDSKRVERLLTVISHFDKKAYSSFFAFNKRQLQSSLAFSKYIEFSEYLNNDNSPASDGTDTIEVNTIKIKYHKTIDWLAGSLADPAKATESLRILKTINDSRISYLLKTCVSNDTPMASLKNSFNELVNKLRDPALFRKYNIPSVSTVMPKELAYQIKALLYRSSPLIYNVSNVKLFLDVSQNSESQSASLKRKLLDDISDVNPALFKDQVRTLINSIKACDLTEKDDQEVLALTETVKTLYKISKALQSQIDFDDSELTSKLQEFVVNNFPTIAKYSVEILALAPNAENVLSAIKSSILPLEIANGKAFVSHIAVLMEIFKFHPHVLDDESTNIVSYLIKEVLLANQVVGNKSSGDGADKDWISDKELMSDIEGKFSALAGKILALKLFTNKLRSIAPDVESDELAKTFTEKTMKLFFYLIASGGEIISENDDANYPTPDLYQTKLRCCAGLQILKLSRTSVMNTFISSSDIIKLANLVEDESLSVRRTFLDKLKEYISNELISIKFLPLIFFTAYEPDNDLKVSTKTWINYTFNRESFRKGTVFERVLPRLIHAISHHPDIVEGLTGSDEEYIGAVTTAIDYLDFFFDSVTTQENFSLLYYLSERVKNYQDMVSEDGDIADEDDDAEDREDEDQDKRAHKGQKLNNERLYTIGELAQMILLQLKAKRNWQHSAYPSKLNLPSDLFKPLDSIHDVQASFKTHIGDKHIELVKSNIKAKVAKIVYTSQTQRQRAQKRLLAHEYNNDHNKRKKVSGSTTNTAPGFGKENDEHEGGGEDRSYNPGKDVKVYDSALRRKTLRERKKNVDYREEPDEVVDNFS
ncbi:sister chromatid cohesion factor PDS5 KNAG_0C05750 [Huiozyma naganishii CBS 8797]|uniref:Sister chromatid cohesion protein PDS5 n=1 Tax=Huiozyma naganishii (strain ATCC MYA-139 / BCRC 22969 / CBS 8797 / KCTC 17520 / NBRC 10181 / NCYC 3082 / Yp74L-3) TaxID=1071383 RepID=J7RJH8_HUIN7|nr:hypothetical protein KNAG_0C05750 [Kazachstania naganishii CBS 8797]CCK69673.1 hypothetical protein KNAG_0C05750 [Kazachstania naganishii CBS 8797]